MVPWKTEPAGCSVCLLPALPAGLLVDVLKVDLLMVAPISRANLLLTLSPGTSNQCSHAVMPQMLASDDNAKVAVQKADKM